MAVVESWLFVEVQLTVLIFPSCEPLPAVPIAEFMQPQEEEQMLGNVL